VTWGAGAVGTKLRIPNASWRALRVGHEEFAEVVLKYFNYLQEDFGLGVVASRRYSVTFENSAVQVGVAWDKTRSYELRVSVSMYGGGHSIFSLDEIVTCRGESHVGRNRNFMAYLDSDVFWCIEKMSEMLREYASDLLRGSPEGFSEMRLLCSEHSATWQREELQRILRAKADAAWSAKDFVAVIRAYEQIEGVLSPSERKKLTYARRQRLRPG